MKYLVIWIVSTWVSTPCPDFKPNPYTGEYPQSMCLVNHGKYESKEMERFFDTKDEAEKFIANSPKDIKNSMKLIVVES